MPAYLPVPRPCPTGPRIHSGPDFDARPVRRDVSRHHDGGGGSVAVSPHRQAMSRVVSKPAVAWAGCQVPGSPSSLSLLRHPPRIDREVRSIGSGSERDHQLTTAGLGPRPGVWSGAMTGPTSAVHEVLLRAAPRRCDRSRSRCTASRLHHAAWHRRRPRQGRSSRDLRHCRQAMYDALTTFTEPDLTRRIQPAGRPARHEIHAGDDRHHQICRTCGDVADVDGAVGDTPECVTKPAIRTGEQTTRATSTRGATR